MNSFMLSGSTSQGGGAGITSLLDPSPAFSFLSLLTVLLLPTAHPHHHPSSTGQPGWPFHCTSGSLSPLADIIPMTPYNPQSGIRSLLPFKPFTSFPNLLCPALPLRRLFVFRHCGQEISVLIEMFEHMEKQFIHSKLRQTIWKLISI